MDKLYLIEQLNSIIEQSNNAKKIKEISKDLILYIKNDNSFINSLTISELEVFNILKNKFSNNHKIIISSNTLAEESKVSRTVVSNLFSKMKNTKVAEIENMGVKGTYIKILDTTIIN